jgi:TRAP-type C4-dicarboxylate transport system permease small subunit
MAWVYGAVPLGGLLMLFHLAVSFLKRGLIENPLFAFEG